MSGPCLCGDPACPSCGPAQGAPACMYRRGYLCGDPRCECAEGWWTGDWYLMDREDPASAAVDVAVAWRHPDFNGFWFMWALILQDVADGQLDEQMARWEREFELAEAEWERLAREWRT